MIVAGSETRHAAPVSGRAGQEEDRQRPEGERDEEGDVGVADVAVLGVRYLGRDLALLGEVSEIGRRIDGEKSSRASARVRWERSPKKRSEGELPPRKRGMMAIAISA